MALRSNPLLYRRWNNPQYGAIASNLASIFTPGSADAENQAQADYYTARAQQEQLKTAAMRDLPLRLNRAPGDDLGTLAGTFLNSGGSAANLGDLLLAINAQQPGATPQGIQMSQLGAGQGYNNTFGAFQAKQAQDLQVERMKDDTERWKLLNTPRNLPANNAMFATPEQRGAWGLPEDGTDPIIGVLQANKGQQINAPGMDPIVNAVTGADGETLGPEGKGVPAWAVRTMLDPNASPQEKAAAQMMLSKPKWAQAPDGTWQMYTPQIPDFSAMSADIGSQDVSRAGEAAPSAIAPTVPTGQVMPAPAGVSSSSAGAQPAAPPTPTTGAPPVTAPGMTVTTVGQPKPYTPNEYQGKAAMWADQMGKADANLNQLVNGAPGLGKDPYQSPSTMAWGIHSLMPSWAAGNFMSSDATRFFTFAEQFLGPILRQESGAAIGEKEFMRYFTRFIPLPNDPPDVVAAKAEMRRTATDMLARASNDPNIKPKNQEEERQLAEQIYSAVGDPYAGGAQGAQPGGGVVEPANPQGRQRASDGKGNWVEWDGSAWVPVANTTGAK